MSPVGTTPPTSTASHSATHIDIYDHVSRAHWASVLGVTDERLRKAVRIVGNRLSSVSAYLAK